MGVEGTCRVGGGVSNCRRPIGLQPWLPTTGMPEPHPLAAWRWQGSGSFQMLTSGAGSPLGFRSGRIQGCCPCHPFDPRAGLSQGTPGTCLLLSHSGLASSLAYRQTL